MNRMRCTIARTGVYKIKWPGGVTPSGHFEEALAIKRRLIRSMMTGEKTKRLASLFGISQGRVSQLRREFMEDWDRFTGERA